MSSPSISDRRHGNADWGRGKGTTSAVPFERQWMWDKGAAATEQVAAGPPRPLSLHGYRRFHRVIYRDGFVFPGPIRAWPGKTFSTSFPSSITGVPATSK